MDAESGMVEQAARLVAANPAQKVGVYRNIIAAQPWFPSVAAKLRDPKYSSWFLPFKDDHSPTVAPRCDSPDPPQKKLCSNLFHGNQQVRASSSFFRSFSPRIYFWKFRSAGTPLAA